MTFVILPIMILINKFLFHFVKSGARSMMHYIPERADFSLRIKNNDLEPVFHKGEFIYVKRVSAIPHGQYGVFKLGNSYHIKRLYLRSGFCRLQSPNPSVPDIPIDSPLQLQCIGLVLK